MYEAHDLELQRVRNVCWSHHMKCAQEEQIFDRLVRERSRSEHLIAPYEVRALHIYAEEHKT